MKNYLIRFKGAADQIVSAHDYTEDAVNGRFWFHKQQDRSDKKSFIEASAVSAILEVNVRIPRFNPNRAKPKKGG